MALRVVNERRQVLMRRHGPRQHHRRAMQHRRLDDGIGVDTSFIRTPAFARAFGSRRCFKVDSPVGPEAGIGGWPGLALEQSIER